MTDITVSQEKMRDLLLRADRLHTDLALSLMSQFEELTGDSIGWDPDAYYTPLEIALKNIAEAVGIDYSEEIVAENYRRAHEEEEE